MTARTSEERMIDELCQQMRLMSPEERDAVWREADRMTRELKALSSGLALGPSVAIRIAMAAGIGMLVSRFEGEI